MPARAWYQPDAKLDELYVIEFYGDPVFDLPEEAVGQEQYWSMFTHGIYANCADYKYLLQRIAISGRHMADPSEMVLAERINHASRILRLMGEESGTRSPGSFWSRRDLLASEILIQEQPQLIASLLASVSKETER